ANLGPGGAGVRGAVQLRLLHSAVRTHLGGEPWAAGQVLINQEELAGTLGTFSVLMLEGMTRFDIDFTAEEAEAYVHVWNVVGYLMGIDERLLQASPAAAAEQFHAIKTRIQAPCDESRALTKALLDFLHEMIPGEALDGFADTLMRHTIGEAMANHLAIPECDWTDCFIPILKRLGCWTDQAGDASRTVSKGLELLQTKLIEGLMGYYSEEVVRVNVPASLQAEWGLGARPA
ncbi:MAG: oxygenase MpaB family protein, partial [Leptospirales bacterium]